MPDAELLTAAKDLSSKERAAAAEMLACLAEVARRKLYLPRYTTLWEYCVKDLRYSETAATRRCQAVEASRKSIEVFSYLKSGEMTLEGVGRVAHLILKQPEKSKELLESVKNKTTRQIETIVAQRDPKADLKDTVRIKPSAPDRVSFSFTGPAALREKIELARDRLRHKYPEGKLEDVLMEAVSVLLSVVERAGKRAAERPLEGTALMAAIPQWVRDKVWERDGGRCTWPLGDGSLCGSTAWPELDHIVPRALGGTNEPSNIRILCRAHNQFSAREQGLQRPMTPH